MKIVIAQHKGGVGKSTLAVHIAATLSERRFSKTLIVDCDSQGDSFRFFASRFPEKPLELVSGMDNVDAMWNPQRERFSTKAAFSEYTHIVVDVDTRINNSLQIILELNPDVVFIPVDDQQLSLIHGDHVVTMINDLIGKFIYLPKVIFVQMGSDWDLLPSNYKIPFSKEFDNCLSNSSYIWAANDELNFMADEFRGLINYANK